MPPRLDPQLALDERAINDADLEAALERRLRAADDVSEARGVYKNANEEVTAGLAKHELAPDSALRIGRFRITKTHLAGRHVEFDADASDRVRISLVDADGKQATRKGTGSFAGKSVSDDEDLRPRGEVNADALRGIADRASEPTPIKRNGQPPASLS